MISPNLCPTKAEKLSHSALSEVKKILNDCDLSSKSNPNEIITFLNDLLNRWKYSKSDTDAEIIFALSFDELREDPLITLRSKLYQHIDKIFIMKIRKEVKLDIPALETALMNLHELGVFNKMQLDKIKVSYLRFCKKMKVLENETLITQMETPSVRKGSMNKFRLNSPENGPEIADANMIRSLSKLSKLSDDDSDGKTQRLDDASTDRGTRDEKELCIICMDRIREIVYLPCAHFLTCPLCGPCLKECPICTHKVEKNLKIYWC